jgi:methyl-accepting chemotaxis protein
MEELVTKKLGAEKWKESLKNAGLPESRYFTVTEDVAEPEILAIMGGIAKASSLSMEQVMEAFGEHWSCVYAPVLYDVYFAKAKNTREMLLNLDQIHVAMTKTIKSARPPRFTYEWTAKDVLVMHYDSIRGMVALMPGLIRGLGKYYKDNPKVTVTGKSIEVRF